MGIEYWERFKQEEVKQLCKESVQGWPFKKAGILSALKKLCIFKGKAYFRLLSLRQSSISGYSTFVFQKSMYEGNSLSSYIWIFPNMALTANSSLSLAPEKMEMRNGDSCAYIFFFFPQLGICWQKWNSTAH